MLPNDDELVADLLDVSAQIARDAKDALDKITGGS